MAYLHTAGLAALCALVLGVGSAAAEPPCDKKSCPSGWLDLDAGALSRAFALAEDYKGFMAGARTELTTVRDARAMARAAGFREWKPGERLVPGSRWYQSNRDRALVLFVVGERPVSEGLRIAAAHVDSPRLELKARPLYEAEGFALFQTSFHGGILNHQWGNTPLALIGRVSRKDGSHVDISVGLKPNEPVFMIAGLSPHVDADLRERKNRDVLAAEELDPIVGSMPRDAEDGVKEQVMAYLRSEYGLGLDDFASAELSLVPAGAPRDVGFDRAMMTMYGQDDRFGAYAMLRAILDLRQTSRTAMVFLADNEEVGNINNTGAGSDYLTDLIGELIFAQMGDAYREPHLKRALAATRVLSTDVNDAVNPTWPSAWEGGNAPRVGQGVNIKAYGQGNNASSEYAAWVRRVFDEAGVKWQTASYKVGRAGGGTLGGELSRRNMDVIDVGAPVMSIHNVYDLSSKADLWQLYRAQAAFFAARD